MREKIKPLLSVIVPAYRQEKTIGNDLLRIQKALEKTRYDYEIICVVDGRVDNTYRNAQKVASRKIRVVGYNRNKGKGYAVRYGMARSRGSLIAFIDAGMEINPEGLSLLLEHMFWYDSDIIVGSIRHSASKVYGYPLKRRVLSWGYHFLTRLLFGLRITDCQRGIKIFKKEVLEKVLPRLLVKKYAFDIEMLAVAKRLGFDKIHDGPVEMNAARMKYSSVDASTVWSMLWDTMAVFYRLKILKYYDDLRRHKRKHDPDLDFEISVG